MKILFVAMSDSVHTARWINQLQDSGNDIYLFPSQDVADIAKEIRWVKVCIPFYNVFKLTENSKVYGLLTKLYRLIAVLKKETFPDYHTKQLKKYIKRLNPDLIHSLETQAAGYLVSDVKSLYYQNSEFPLWWHTNWGSDIYLFERIPAHQEKIKQVMNNCDYYSCECFRDIELALKNGFKGKLLPVYPNTGGFDLDELKKIREQSVKPSQRKFILLKGYQGWAGRALVGFRALERCADLLNGFEIIIHSNTQAADIQIASALFTNTTNIPVTLVPINTPHHKILELHSKARISIGLSISDAISTSLLEAMAMGSFPIQSYTACAEEWITDKITGIIVPPEDPEIIELAIRKALIDDQLVDSAFETNILTIAQKADYKLLQNITINTYRKILNLIHET